MPTPTVTVDLSPLIQAVIPIAVSGLSIAGTAALGFLAQKFHVQVKQDQVDNLDKALEKALTYGAMQLQDTIAKNGYDNVATQDQIVGLALTYAVDKFPSTLRSAGLSTNIGSFQNEERLREVLKRAIPNAMTKFEASPATPSRSHPPVKAVVP